MKQMILLLALSLILALPGSSGAAPNPTAEWICPEKDEGGSSSTFSYDGNKNLLTITFVEGDLEKNQPEQASYLKQHMEYPIEEDFELPMDLCEALGSAKPIVVKVGVYPVTYEEGVFTITIQL